MNRSSSVDHRRSSAVCFQQELVLAKLPCDANVVSCERKEDTGRLEAKTASRRARTSDSDAIARGGVSGFLVQFSLVFPVCLCTREHTAQIMMLWTHRRLESQAIKRQLSCHPDSFSISILHPCLSGLCLFHVLPFFENCFKYLVEKENF